MNVIRDTLAKSAEIKAAYHWLSSGVLSAGTRLSPSLVPRCRFRLAWGRWPNLDTPTTFDERLQWLNLFWRHQLKARCGDKFGLRGYVEEHQLGHLLPQLFGVYSSADEIRLDTLPDRFVLKCAHGCKTNVFCPDKRRLEWNTVKRSLDAWMRIDYRRHQGEIHYGHMTPRIICEEFFQDDTGQELPVDYKVFCFGGKAYCTMAATARDPNGIAKLAFYDLQWKKRLPYCVPELATEEDIAAPSAYDEMVDCAQRLSQPFPFVRVDFYSINGRARLGEMTFTPGACVSADYMTNVAQQELGRLIELPDRLI
jgi:hypothetical protein